MKTFNEEDVKKIEETLYEEIKRRDEIIDKLRKENQLLLKTALKQSQEKIIRTELEEKTNKNEK